MKCYILENYKKKWKQLNDLFVVALKLGGVPWYRNEFSVEGLYRISPLTIITRSVYGPFKFGFILPSPAFFPFIPALWRTRSPCWNSSGFTLLFNLVTSRDISTRNEGVSHSLYELSNFHKNEAHNIICNSEWCLFIDWVWCCHVCPYNVWEFWREIVIKAIDKTQTFSLAVDPYKWWWVRD